MISVMEMKDKLSRAMEMLQTVCHGMSTLEDRVLDGTEFDGAQATIEENVRKLADAVSVAGKAVQAPSTSVSWTLTRKNQHQYLSPGDPKPTLKAIGPSRLLIEIHFDEGDVRRAVYGKGGNNEGEYTDSSREQKTTA